jgi:hypothetical protein
VTEQRVGDDVARELRLFHGLDAQLSNRKSIIHFRSLHHLGFDAAPVGLEA